MAHDVGMKGRTHEKRIREKTNMRREPTAIVYVADERLSVMTVRPPDDSTLSRKIT
jgi:hypothetical protein